MSIKVQTHCCITLYICNFTDALISDIHPRSIELRIPAAFEKMTTKQLYRRYGEPTRHQVQRCDRKTLPNGVPATVTAPISLREPAESFTIADARLLLSNPGSSSPLATASHSGPPCSLPLQYRPLENILEPETQLSSPLDIWSLAATIWEVVGRQSLLSGQITAADDFLAAFVEVLGPLKPKWRAKGSGRGAYFDDCGNRIAGRQPPRTLEQAFVEDVQRFRHGRGLGDFGNDEARAFIEMMRGMLRFRPEERLTAKEVLQSEWMVRWARVDYWRARIASA